MTAKADEERLNAPRAVSLSQDELARMTKAQLMQCCNVLHGGWAKAVQRVNQLESAVEQMQEDARKKAREEDMEHLAMSEKLSQAQEEIFVVQQHRQRLEVEVIDLRRAVAPPAPDDSTPSQRYLEGQLIDAKAQILALEKAIRKRTPVTELVLSQQISSMKEQREADKKRIQSLVVEVQHLRAKLLDQEEPPGTRSRCDACNSPINFVVADAQAPTVIVSRPHSPAVQLPSPFNDAACQTDAFLVRAIELLRKREEEITELRATVAKTTDALDAREKEVTQLKIDLEQQKLRPANNGGQIISATSVHSSESRSSSEAEEAPIEPKLQARVAELMEKTQRKENEAEILRKQVESAETKATETGAELKRVSKSFAVLAHENVVLSQQLHSLTPNASPQRLSEILAAAEQVGPLRVRVAELEKQLRDNAASHQELEELAKENSLLNGKVEKYQQEIAVLTINKKNLVDELKAVEKRTGRTATVGNLHNLIVPPELAWARRRLHLLSSYCVQLGSEFMEKAYVAAGRSLVVDSLTLLVSTWSVALRQTNEEFRILHDKDQAAVKELAGAIAVTEAKAAAAEQKLRERLEQDSTQQQQTNQAQPQPPLLLNLGLVIKTLDENGHCSVAVVGVDAGGRASLSGLAVGDHIIAVNSIPIGTVEDFESVVRAHLPVNGGLRMSVRRSSGIEAKEDIVVFT